MFLRHLQFSFIILIVIKAIIANTDDGYVTNFSRTSSYVSKQATNREELNRSSNLEKELSKLRSNVREPCGGGRLQHSANLQDGTGSIACTTSEYKVTSDKLRDLDLSKTGLSKLKLGSSSHDLSSKQNSHSSSSSLINPSSKTYFTPTVITPSTKTSTSDGAPYDKYTSYSHSSTNIKTDLPSYSRYTDQSKTFSNTKPDLSALDLRGSRKTHDSYLSAPITSSSLNINTNSGQLASKPTNQIDAANSHLDASSKILSQQHSGQSTVGRSIHGLHAVDTHSLSNAQNQHYSTSFQSKTYGGSSSSVDFSGLNYSKTRLPDHSDLHKDSKTNQAAYTKTFDTKGQIVHKHNERLRIVDHTVKGAPIRDNHGTSELITEEEERRIENERRKNIVRLNSSDKLNSRISTNKTDTYLFCESGEMLVKINFTKRFHGIVYANNRDSACRILGNGAQSYELHIPLNGCGTKKDERLFVNNITVRFHQTLELEEDEIKTIICRYPPPATPIPVYPLIPITKPAPILATHKLNEIELLLVICILIFLPMLLTGLALAYYGLKRRNINIYRKSQLLSGAPSQITKISHSTFEPVRIPRVAVSDYTSESETRTILSDSSSIRRDQYHNQKLQHIPELKVQLLDTTYLANQRFVEEETENIVNKKTTANYFKKVPPLPPGSIPDNDLWSHSEITDIVEQKEVVIKKPTYTMKSENERFIDLEKDMSIEERIIKNRNITLPTPPTPKYQVKNINDTFVTNIKETAASCEKLCDYVVNNQNWQNQYGGGQQHKATTAAADSKYLSRSSSLKYEDSFFYERKYNVLKNLFDQPLPSTVSPPKAGFSYLTKDEKTRWHSLITTDETFRSLMIESSSYDDYIRVSRDLRYEHYFSPRTWETIINTLSNREIIARWNANVYEDQKFNDNVELSFNSETQELLKKSQEQKQFGGAETISYSKQISKLVDGAREKLMEQQFESSQSVYRAGGGGLVSIPRLSSSSTRTAEHKSLLDQEEVKSVTETQVDDHYYKRTLRK